MAGDRILRVIIAGDAEGAIRSLENFNRGLERTHEEASRHGSGIAGAFAGALAKVAIAAAGITVTAGVIADELYKIGAPYEQLLNQIQAFSHASSASMQELESYLYQISPQLAKYGLTSEDAADAIAKLTKAGLSLKAAQEAVIPVLTLAKGGTLDVADAANFTAEAMNVWNLKASQATMVADALVGASHSSTTSVKDMGNSLSFSAAAAAHAGLSFQQTAAFLAEVANAGVAGSKAGTALKDILVNLEAPTSAASKAMKSLGINVYDGQGKMKDFGQILGMLHDKLGGLSEQQQAIYVKDIFGKIPLESALTIIKGGTGAYQKYLDLVSRTGEASVIAGAKSQGLSGAIARTGAQFESMGQALYLKVAPVFTKIVNAFADSLPKLGGLASKAVDVISKVFNDMGGTGALKGFGKGLQKALQAVTPLFLSLAGTLSKVFASAKSQGVFDAIGKALHAIGSLLTGVVIPQFKQFVDFIVNVIVPKVVPIWENKILPGIKAVADFVSGTLVPKFKAVMLALQPLISFVEQFISQKLIPLISWAITQLKPVFKELGGVISSLLDFLAPLIKFLTPIIEWLVNQLSGPVISVVKGFFNGLVRLVTGLLEILKGVLDFLTGIFTGHWSKVWHGLGEIFSGALNALIGFAKAVIFGKLIKIFLDGGKAIVDLFKSAGKGMMDGLASAGKWILNFWKAGFKDQLKLILDGWKALAKIFSDGVDAVQKFLSGGWKRMLGDVVQWGKDMLSEARRALDKIASEFTTGMRDTYDAVVKGGKDVIDWFKNLPSTLLGYVKDAAKWLLQAGKDVVSGLINGITSKAKDVGSVVTSLASKVKSAFSSFLGIFSPSRVFHEFGVNTAQGYVNGVGTMTDKVQKAMRKMGAILPTVGGHKSLQLALAGAGVSLSVPSGYSSRGAAAGALTGLGLNAVQPVNVTVNVAGSVAKEKDLAKSIAVHVRDEIRQIARKNGGRTGLS